MLGLPLVFTLPGILAALAALPVLYVLLRLTPPRPRTMPLPSLRLIRDLLPRNETPARTPPWLLLLRLAAAALLIGAMAGPLWNPTPVAGAGRGPLLLVLDDGFAAAPDWDARLAAARQRVNGAVRAGRIVAVTGVADGARAIEAVSPTEVLDRLRARVPAPVEPDRRAALPAVKAFVDAHPGTEIAWITDGLERGNARAFAEGLAALATDGALGIIAGETPPPALAGAANAAASLDVRVLRAAPGGPQEGTVEAYDAKGLPLGQAPFSFSPDATMTTARFTLPVELRNDMSRLAITGVRSAGAVALLDGRAKRRRVAVVTGESADVAQPLLSPAFYITRALAPFAAVSEARGGTTDPIGAMLDNKPSVMVLADVGSVTGTDEERLAAFVAEGGVLLRFAGARLAAATPDDLVPVALRRGGRTFGGALSWDKPKALAAFEAPSPFVGLVPPAEVTVSRQVLAEPDAGLPGKTWAQLTDGTPLVTAEKRGKGLIVLVHVTADTTWSNLPLSGLFVDMLRRVVDLAPTSVAAGSGQDTGVAPGLAEAGAALPPTRTLDGFGALQPPPARARPVPASYTDGASLDHPPGFYGPGEAALAVNALQADDTLAPLDLQGLKAERQGLGLAEPIDLRAWLLAAALAFFIGDTVASLWLGGGLRRPARAATVAMLAGLLALGALPGCLAPLPAHAADAAPLLAPRDMDAALTTRLGYVVTGDGAVDEASRLGLAALSHALAGRTSLTPGDPVGLDPARDELSFYPLIYWPVVATTPQPPAAAVERIAAFMRQGGTVVFDTRDALSSHPDGPPTPEALWLQTLLRGVDVPALEPVPADHVVTKTFYLLTGFVGRTTSGQTWIEALPPAAQDGASRPVRAGDSVSPIVITANDLAAAWAVTPDGDPLYPLVPGDARQREMALRGGINLVMYTLTGNYKADQVHVRDLLERLAH